jgi:hypothetical protein
MALRHGPGDCSGGTVQAMHQSQLDNGAHLGLGRARGQGLHRYLTPSQVALRLSNVPLVVAMAPYSKAVRKLAELAGELLALSGAIVSCTILHDPDQVLEKTLLSKPGVIVVWTGFQCWFCGSDSDVLQVLKDTSLTCAISQCRAEMCLQCSSSE